MGSTGQSNLFQVQCWGHAAERWHHLLWCVEQFDAFAAILEDYAGALLALRNGIALNDLLSTSKIVCIDNVCYDLLAYEYQSVTLGIAIVGRAILVVDVETMAASEEAREIAQRLNWAWVR